MGSKAVSTAPWPRQLMHEKLRPRLITTLQNSQGDGHPVTPVTITKVAVR